MRTHGACFERARFGNARCKRLSLVKNLTVVVNTMADNLQKRPAKGILKNSSSFDQQDQHSNAKKSKETKWDEMNIIATLHPPDKDYGHMKIDEPKTPYNFEYSKDEHDNLDPALLAEKIRLGAAKPPKALSSEENSEEDEDLTPEERAQRKEFESRRKKHYNEYYAVKMARKLLEEEEDEDDDDVSSAGTSKTSNNLQSSETGSDGNAQSEKDCCEREACPRKSSNNK